MTAEGNTIIADPWQISKGCNDFVTRINSLGGYIEVARGSMVNLKIKAWK